MWQIEILDSSLRDGAQAEGIFIRWRISCELPMLWTASESDLIEAGNPASNPKDMELFCRIAEHPLQQAKMVAFGATRRPGIRVEEDAGCSALIAAGTDYVSIFGKSWDLHVSQVLKTSLSENLKMIQETVSYFSKAGKMVFLMRSIFLMDTVTILLTLCRQFWQQSRQVQKELFYVIPMEEAFRRKLLPW